LVFDFQGSLTGEMVDHGFLNPRGLAHGPLRRLERWIDRRPRLILTNGRHSARLLTEEFGAPAERLRLAPDVVDATRFQPSAGLTTPERQARRAALGIAPETILVVYLGLLAPYQGIDLLLHAMRAVDAGAPLHLLIMGFPNVARYQRLAGELGIEGRVTFSGPIRYDDAPAMLALGDIAVGPKISATEGSGKLLNYMALGLPTVAFDTLVSREYLGEAGVLAPVGDAPALAAALADLAGRPAERRARGEALRRRAVEQFGIGRSIAAIEAAYREIAVSAQKSVEA
jgi:glycosyltransferase involved in cell wall biosynthesis